MSFSFAFNEDIDELDSDLALAFSTTSLQPPVLNEPARGDEATTSALPHEEILLSTLLATLPPVISYTPVTILLSSTTTQDKSSRYLLRRDLFDARFQLISQDDDDREDACSSDEPTNPAPQSLNSKGKAKAKASEEFIVDESTDLVIGVYEGGLKTWECSLDLVDYLHTTLGFDLKNVEEVVRGKRILEIGCGTSLPTCAVWLKLLDEIKRNPSDPDGPLPKATVLHLQDYNQQVLSLITLPNLLLTYFLHLTPSLLESELLPGELEIDSSFLESFESLLAVENIHFKFSAGDWSSMTKENEKDNEQAREADRYDLILTSETIYSLDSLDPLLDLLYSSSSSSSPASSTQCLVACKRIYFGVGGGEVEFRKRVEERDGQVSTVWGGEGVENTGVGRVVMRVQWE